MTTVQKNPFDIKFNNEFARLIENLLKIYESDRVLLNQIKKLYIYYKKEVIRSDFITDLVDNMELHIQHIKTQNEQLFSDDYSKDSICLLGGQLNFKDLWKSPLLEDQYKDNIWAHLKNLYLLGCNYIKRQNEHMKQIVTQLKTEAMIKRDITDKDKKHADKSKGFTDSELFKEMMGLFTELFGEQSFIHELIQIDEIKSILDEFKNNPVKTVRHYLANNGKNMKDVLEGITMKLRSMVVSGNMDTEKITRDVKKIQRMVDKLKNELQTDPKFKDALDHIRKVFNIDLRKSNAFDDPSELINKFFQQFSKMGQKTTTSESEANTEDSEKGDDKSKEIDEIQKLTDVILDLSSTDGGLSDELLTKLKKINPNWETDLKVIKDAILGEDEGECEELKVES